MKNEKLIGAARLIRQWCANQVDCKSCPFAKDGKHCTINTVPQMWEDELLEGCGDEVD